MGRWLILGIFTCLAAGFWSERAPVLQKLANLWIISDDVTHADAIVVLGGGLDDRPFSAADLYRDGFARKILVSQVANDPASLLGVTLNHTEANRQVLLKLGVPADAIETFGTANSTTYEEAIALSAWANQNNASTFIVPTEIFSARRVKFIFQRNVSRAKIEILAVDPPLYRADDWWRSDTGIISFQNEILKYIYYRLKY